jgi:hypothetical protein
MSDTAPRPLTSTDQLEAEQRGLPVPFDATPRTVTAEPVDDQLAELASALCMDAQVIGYDHGQWPTLVSFQPPYCSRHLGIAVNVRASLMERSDEAALTPSDPLAVDRLRAALDDVKKSIIFTIGYQHGRQGHKESPLTCSHELCQASFMIEAHINTALSSKADPEEPHG